MAAPEPQAKNLANLYKLAPLDWADVRRALETNLTQGPGTGGPGTFWLSSINADGRPHMSGVGSFWVDGRSYYSLCGRPLSRKIRNIERDPRCAFGLRTGCSDRDLARRAVYPPEGVRRYRLSRGFAIPEEG
ncbi:MAG: pyridoxamine 5'-phosphate oxidase family protein [Solirubrobacteraceae bacterium]